MRWHGGRKAVNGRQLPNQRPGVPQRVGEQHGDGHRTHTARHRGDVRGPLGRGGELDVPHQLAAGKPVDAHVDDDRARLHPCALDELRHAHRRHQDVRPGNLRGQVALAVADRHRCVGVEQEERHGASHQDAPADHDRPLATGLAVNLLEHPHHAPGSGGDRRVASLRQEPGVQRVQAVGVLLRPEDAQELVRAHLLRDRELDQDAVHRVVGVEGLEPGLHLGVAGGLGEVVLGGMEADLGRGLLLAGDVDLARGILAHPDDRQSGHAAGLLLELAGALGHLLPDFERDGLAVNQCRCHGGAHYTSRAVAEGWLDAGRRTSVASAHVPRAHRPPHPRRRSGGAAHPLVHRPQQGFKLPVKNYFEFVELITARPDKVASLDDYLKIMHTWTEKIQSSPDGHRASRLRGHRQGVPRQPGRRRSSCASTR